MLSEEEIYEILQTHRGSAGEFCVGCSGPDEPFVPPREQLEDWDTVGITRHQAAMIYYAYDVRDFIEKG